MTVADWAVTMTALRPRPVGGGTPMNLGRDRQRRSITMLATTVGATLLILLSIVTSAFAHGDTALIMGGTGNPGPDANYLAKVNANYIQRLYQGYNPIAQFTPEQGFPLTPALGIMTFDQSVAAGVDTLHAGIKQQIAAGNKVVVFGYSQSATVATNEMRKLADAGNPDSSDLSFILVGNPNNPNGGLFERFHGLYIPFFDESFNGATPPDTPYRTDIYTVQYDGYADAPQYPLNLLADLNALAGAVKQHFIPSFTAQINGSIPGGTYPVLPAPGQAVQLPTSPGYYENGGKTHYYMILSQNLPILDPLRVVPIVGKPLAELIQPDLRVLIDLGYGNGYANVPTPAGLIPRINLKTVVNDLVVGARQGITAALVALKALPSSKLPNAYPYLPSAKTPGITAQSEKPKSPAATIDQLPTAAAAKERKQQSITGSPSPHLRHEDTTDSKHTAGVDISNVDSDRPRQSPTVRDKQTLRTDRSDKPHRATGTGSESTAATRGPHSRHRSETHPQPFHSATQSRLHTRQRSSDGARSHR